MKENLDINDDWEESKRFLKTKNEEFLDIDEKLIQLEKNSNVIRLEMNTIELPLFSRNPKRAKNEIKAYHFKADKSSYLEIEAPAGYAIPGEFEERVFIGLTKIMKKNNYSRKFVVSVNEILENLGLTNPIYYKKIKNSLVLLSKTNYTFFNSLYSNKDLGILDKEVISSIMSVTVITRRNEEYKNINAFNDGRVKEVYEIVLSDYFYNNIVTKGYMAFDAEKLLLIENSIARSIFTLIEKWRGYGLYLRRPAFFIARRIPLRWNKLQIRRTIDTIEKALIILKNLNLIKEYKIIKEKKWELTEIEIIFNEEHNKIKREMFFTEKNEYNNFETIITTETKRKVNELSLDMSLEIINLFPESVKSMKTFKNLITDSIVKFGFEYVKLTSEYVILQNPKSFKSYLNQALENNWADEYISKKKSKDIIQIINPSEQDNKIKITENKYSYDSFKKFPDFLKEKIVDKVYNNFLSETSTSDNPIMRKIFDKSKRALIVKYINENYVEEESKNNFENKSHVEELKNMKILKKYISVTKFLFEIQEILIEKKIPFDLEKVAPIFKAFLEFEDEFIKIKYDMDTKLGEVLIK